MKSSNLLTHLLCGLVIGATSMTAGNVVTSTSPGNETFYFTGTCHDCSGSVSATLVLSSSYTVGTSILSSEVISFNYGGSNLLSPFTILPTDSNFSVTGTIPTNLPGTANVDISNSSIYFYSESGGASDGNWSVGTPSRAPSDYGFTSSWSGAAPSTTPEPASFGLLGLGLAGVALLARRRAQR